MPIFRSNNKLIYFSHIPKTGGSSIENLIRSMPDINLSFCDHLHYERSRRSLANSSPQHISGADLSLLFPPNFFDAYFTIVRNPFDRFFSAFTYHKFRTNKIPMQVNINDFLADLENFKISDHQKYDLHFMPQLFFLRPKVAYEVFKFENGLKPVKDHIGFLFDKNLNEFTLPHILEQPIENKMSIGLLGGCSKKIIMHTYKLDFESFEY
jgi:hypothetical protein